jgi:hypothetical protein
MEETKVVPNDETVVGYCAYCKSVIRTWEKHRIKEGVLKHNACIREERGLVEELKFD